MESAERYTRALQTIERWEKDEIIAMRPKDAKALLKVVIVFFHFVPSPSFDLRSGGLRLPLGVNKRSANAEPDSNLTF